MNTPRYVNKQRIVPNRDCNFVIDVFELTEICPFDVKRIYTLRTAQNPEKRGEHAHINQLQIIFLLQGSVSVQLIDKYGQESTWVLGQQGLLVPEKYWIELSMSKESEILCLASQKYCNLITEYNKEAFLNSYV